MVSKKWYVNKYLLIEPIWVLKRGLEHGNGVQIWIDGSQYESFWQNDKANGKHTFYWPNGRKYKGEWKNLKAEWISITAMQNFTLKFLHDSNGLPNKANEKSSRNCFLPARILDKNCFQIIWEDGLRSDTENIIFQIQIWEGTFYFHF